MKSLFSQPSVKSTKLGRAILKSNYQEVYRDTEKIFMWLLWTQWILAVTLAVLISPFTWAGHTRSVNFHVEIAVIFGGVLTIFPFWLLRTMPGTTLSRFTVTIAQSFWSILLVHLTGGRIETHFHIFGSLAIIAFFRDWRLLVPATLAIAGAHFAGIFTFSESIYGVSRPEWWRFLEHSGWVIFEDIFLFFACIRSSREMEVLAERQAELETLQDGIQQEIEEKTSELIESSEQRERLQMELLQAHKLESVGRLAAGIAHEINTPIQYVTDSVFFANDGVSDLFRLLDRLESSEEWDLDPVAKEKVLARIEQIISEAEIGYLRENLPSALQRSADGLHRVAEIVRSMKSFAHPDQVEMVPADLNEAIKTTLVVCRNEYKYLANVEQDLGDIPLVTCHAGEINQVLTNLIVNAAHAISSRYIDPSMMGTISIRTYQSGENVIIEFADTGCGIPTENLNRIFEPFFTTKGIGRGTGQGLGIVHGVIVTKLGGSISVDSKVDEGTTFILTIPIHQSTEAEAA